MPRKKKTLPKKKPEIISRFFRLARGSAEHNGFSIQNICQYFKCSLATIYNYEDQRRQLTYDQLKTYVEFYGLPAGVMLIMTRLAAELRDGHFDDAERIARGVRAVADYVIVNKTALAARDYQAQNGKEQDITLQEFWNVYKAHGLYKPAWSEPDPNSD